MNANEHDDMTDDARRFAEMMEQRPELSDLRPRRKTTTRDMIAFTVFVLGFAGLIAGVTLSAFQGEPAPSMFGLGGFVVGVITAAFLCRPRD